MFKMGTASNALRAARAAPVSQGPGSAAGNFPNLSVRGGRALTAHHLSCSRAASCEKFWEGRRRSPGQGERGTHCRSWGHEARPCPTPASKGSWTPRTWVDEGFDISGTSSTKQLLPCLPHSNTGLGFFLIFPPDHPLFYTRLSQTHLNT